MTHHDIIVIGGGPAGIFAAGFAARQGKKVLLLEKNRRCGAKVMITGKGRCNLTHSETDPQTFCAAFGRNGRALLTALYAFGVDDTIDFFEQHGLPVRVERGGRIFPARGGAPEVRKVLETFLTDSGVDLLTACPVLALDYDGSRVAAIETRKGAFRADQIIVATGGLSYPRTGCTGDGYRWAEASGHGLIEPQPALVPLVLKEEWTEEISHFNLKHVKVRVRQGGKILVESFGEAFFTRNGIGGPIILDLSAAVREALKQGPVELLLDLKPALSGEQFDLRLQREFEAQANKDFRNALGTLLPRDMIPLMIRLSGIESEKKCHSVTRSERRSLVKLFKELPLHVHRCGGFDKAIITAGGVSLKDIDPRTMRSKKIENLYFAGEMIDLDGPTGGYNLQLCWSTGYLAGVSAAAGVSNA